MSKLIEQQELRSMLCDFHRQMMLHETSLDVANAISEVPDQTVLSCRRIWHCSFDNATLELSRERSKSCEQ